MSYSVNDERMACFYKQLQSHACLSFIMHILLCVHTSQMYTYLQIFFTVGAYSISIVFLPKDPPGLPICCVHKQTDLMSGISQTQLWEVITTSNWTLCYHQRLILRNIKALIYSSLTESHYVSIWIEILSICSVYSLEKHNAWLDKVWWLHNWTMAFGPAEYVGRRLILKTREEVTRLCMPWSESIGMLLIHSLASIYKVGQNSFNYYSNTCIDNMQC